MGLDATKPIFVVSDKARLKLKRLARKLKMLLVASLDMLLSNLLITKALISLRADWSVLLLFANPKTGFLASRLIWRMHVSQGCSLVRDHSVTLLNKI